jgi:hypothetical protein
VLVLHEKRNPKSRFLDVVSQICLASQATPVVVTMASSEGEARLRQRFAEETVGSYGLEADFDFFVGYDVRAAVALAARWHRCSHVFVEKQNARLWQRWLGGDTMQRLLGLSDSLTFFTVSGDDVPAKAAAGARPAGDAESGLGDGAVITSLLDMRSTTKLE